MEQEEWKSGMACLGHGQASARIPFGGLASLWPNAEDSLLSETRRLSLGVSEDPVKFVNLLGRAYPTPTGWHV